MRDDVHHFASCPTDCAECHCLKCKFQSFHEAGHDMRDLHMTRGERLECRAGSCLQFWIVKSGTAATCTTLEDGRRQIVGLELPGAVVCGAMAGEGSETWLEALSDCEICELDLTDQARKLRRDPDFLALTFHLIHGRLENSLRHMTTLGRLDSQERLTLFLAETACKGQKTVDGGHHAYLTMSREDIADYLGLNTETVSRILSRIKKSGLVRFLSPTEFVVPDLEALARRVPVPVPGHTTTPSAFSETSA